jgi:CDGSH-type Zn-finger protein
MLNAGHKFKIKVMKDGAYLVTGSTFLDRQKIVYDQDKYLLEYKKEYDYSLKESYMLCRCGKSKNKPYCDGTHDLIKFDGTETAGDKPYLENVEEIDGPGMKLYDQPKLCALAHFCTRDRGTWELTRRCNDPSSRDLAIKEAGDCPSGRLVLVDKKTGQVYEPEFEPSISIIEDEVSGVSGPIWVKAGIPIESASGIIYEKRNRVTLCRCGASKHKPFCDGSHLHIGFQDDK